MEKFLGSFVTSAIFKAEDSATTKEVRMNIEVVARDIEVTPDVQERLERKLERILERRNREQPVRVQIESIRGRFQTHISMHIQGKEVFGQAEEKNLGASVDEACDKVDRQISRIYDKMTAKR